MMQREYSVAEMHRLDWLTPARFIIANTFIWWLIQIIAKPSLDSYGDMVEVFAWAQHWLLGSSKHPQFLPWIARLWFSVMPETVISFYTLSALNLALAMVGIAAFGRSIGLEKKQILIALALQALAFPYLTLAAKLNMNSILLVMWPWMAHAFLRLTQTMGRAQLLWAAWFGLISAAALLSKYYSVVLLISFFGASLMPRLRGLWRGPAPFISLVFLIGAILPHLIWLNDHRESLGYAAEQGSSGVGLKQLVKFSFTPLTYWPIPLIIGLTWLYKGPLLRRMTALARMQSGDEILWFSATGPLLVTLAFGAVGLAEMSQPWGIPIGFAYTLLLVRNRTVPEARADRLPQGFRMIWPAFLLLSIVYTLVNGQNGKTWHYMPETASSIAILERWTSEHPDQPPLAWASSGNDSARLAFFSPPNIRPEALPSLPDQLPSYFPDRPLWRTEAGVIVCGITPNSESKATEACLIDASEWATIHGLQSSPFKTTVSPSGWRFPKTIPFIVSVVYVWPLD